MLEHRTDDPGVVALARTLRIKRKLTSDWEFAYDVYYDKGWRDYWATGPTSGVMTTFQAETYSTEDCLTVIGWYKQALRMCGAKDVEIVEDSCRANGGECCRYLLRWK